jgi:hypothetical protein
MILCSTVEKEKKLWIVNRKRRERATCKYREIDRYKDRDDVTKVKRKRL